VQQLNNQSAEGQAAKSSTGVRDSVALSAEVKILFGAAIVALIMSGIEPTDRLTWFLETLPIMIGVPALVGMQRHFPLTPLLYRLLFLHALILALGGHYTYAEVPLGFWFQDVFEFSRNHYDRLGHFAQGFVPAILVRELLIRTSPLAGSRWLPVLTVSVCLAFSAFYEMIEWWSAVVLDKAADAFLGTQGDPWDTQWDMFLALFGAMIALLLLSRRHDRQIDQLVESR
jgi:putative membrane protein